MIVERGISEKRMENHQTFIEWKNAHMGPHALRKSSSTFATY